MVEGRLLCPSEVDGFSEFCELLPGVVSNFVVVGVMMLVFSYHLAAMALCRVGLMCGGGDASK